MNFWVGIVIGLILGWVLEWVIDWRFWRREEAQSTAVRSIDLDLQGKLAALEAEKESLSLRLQELLKKEPEVVIKEVVKEVVVERDRLQKIHGIGDVFARRFNDAGIFSYAQLASLDPERAREIINPEDWQAVEPEQWIVEAKQFAEESKQA